MKPKTAVGIDELKEKIKSSEESGMETIQVEQLDALINQSVKVLNKNHDTEDTDTSNTLKWYNRSMSPFDSKDTQIEMVMTEKRDTSSVPSGQQLKMIGPSKFITEPQKVAIIN